MKHIKLLIFCVIIFNASKSQTIYPLLTNEYCPNTEYTFTVTIPKTYSNIIGVGGCYVTQLPTPPVGSTFTFKGKFADVNAKQTFRITYTDNTTLDFDFKKIKSLFFGSSCTPIQPNQSIISAPLCQIVNIPINFNNVQWSTAFESPALCFGSITTYEYLLPNGWSIGSNVSNGSTWIAGGNNVTIKSDLSNGINSSVFIRPVNNCGTGFVNGQSHVIQIPISRPAPVFTISGPSQFCTSQTFQIANLPIGATVQWYISQATFFSYTQSNNVLTVNRIADGDINITATVTTCQTFNAVPKNVRVGGNPITITAIQTACDATDFSVAGAASGATYNWSSANGTILYNGTSTTATTSSPYISATTSVGNSDIAVVNTNNSCSQSVFISKQLQYTYPRQIDGVFDTYSNGDQVNASVNTTSFDSYYKWYINGSIDYEGADASYYSTSYSGVGSNIVCGENTIRVEVIACGVVSSSDEIHFYKMGNCYFRSNAPSVDVFPNPAKDIVTIKLKDVNKLFIDQKSVEGIKDIKEIRVLNKFGKVLKIYNLPVKTKLATINISNLPLDIYFIKVSDGKNNTMLQLSVLK